MDRKKLIRRFFIINAVFVLTVAAFAVFLYYYRDNPNMSCVFLKVFHLYCPGCGGTRALFSLLHGDILASLAYNPLLILTALFVLFYEIAYIVHIFGNVKPSAFFLRLYNILPIIFVVIVILFAVIRNLLVIFFKFDPVGDLTAGL
jgi:hypothetical protein